MSLSEYLIKNDIRIEDFAAKIGVHQTTIYRVLTGRTIPKRQNLKKILEATNGEVSLGELMARVFPRSANSGE
jgi:transcriptional regulator with XRE-family HTH domain